MALQPKKREKFEPFQHASTLAMKRWLPVSADEDKHELLMIARHLYSARKSRAEAFAAYSMVFHEPPWDMLLDLYIARMEQRVVSATAACVAANVPATSGLRWISTLRQRGLVDLRADPTDGRRTIVRLSNRATKTMERYLKSL